MTKLTYTLAIINGTVCYECQPSTPHAFYSCGGCYSIESDQDMVDVFFSNATALDHPDFES